jgi:hypothetical protein
VTAFAFKLIWQVNYGQGFEGAFSDTYTTAYAQRLHDHRFIAFESYGFYLASNRRAEPVAYFSASLGLAFVGI